MKSTIAVMCSVVLAGCLPQGNFQITPTSSSASFSVPTMVSGNCGAAALQGLLNQGESALEAVVLPEGTRIIRPGSAFSRDAIRERLNIGIAADGTIVHVACG